MHGLGVPTTRALSLVGTGIGVFRDLFYDGNPTLEPGAVVCRVAPSFVRFGTFQLPAERGGEEREMVKLLADYVIRHHFPHLEDGPGIGERGPETSGAAGQGGVNGVSGSGEWAEGPSKYNKYAALFKEVAERTGRLVALWQGVSGLLLPVPETSTPVCRGVILQLVGPPVWLALIVSPSRRSRG
jgi:uncharacterized protein YdiU (UPF0061 family)